VLIVEFAKQQQEQGKHRFDAAIEAARLRLRPILMTSFAFILGVLPLVYATGAGSEMRRALGNVVFFGMLGVTFFGIFLTPVFYVSIRWWTESVLGIRKIGQHELPESARHRADHDGQNGNGNGEVPMATIARQEQAPTTFHHP
jgi:HAE1 family hydrophobic/amphiphilic exporter-1